MPLFSTRGAGSAKGFGLTSGAGPFNVDYLVVAGAGSSARDNTGGGGAGGFRFSNQTFSVSGAPAAPRASATGLEISKGSYPITVGAGGTAVVCNFNAFDGTPSVFSTITSTGGGGGNGCAGNTSPLGRPGNPGGSGGGAGQVCGAPSPTVQGGTGNSPPTSPPQGSNGGLTNNPGGGGAGGGGAMAAGGQCGTKTGGAGAGVPTTAFGSNGVLCGSFRYYAGGGGGGAPQGGGSAGTGGIGGGAPGRPGCAQPAAPPGTTNTGGGAGGSSQAGEGGNGGSGIVVIRAPKAAFPRVSVSPGTNTKTTGPDGEAILTFTVTGTLTVL